MLWGYKQQGELLMNARRMLLVSVVALMSVPVHGQQMFKCTVNGKPTFQQMPCSPTNVGERMPLKSLPGTGEGLREGEIGLIVEKERQEAYEQAKREAEAKASEAEYARHQASRLSREDEAKIENANSTLRRHYATKEEKSAARGEINQVYAKKGLSPPMQEPIVVKKIIRNEAPTTLKPDYYGGLKGPDGSRYVPDGFGGLKKQ
ncbi:MAG: hypothetical protein ABTQ93_14970 [Candidatus Competibacter denitrificans]